MSNHSSGIDDTRHLDDIWWHQAPVPAPNHECWAQTSGWIDLTQIERCACGAVRRNGRMWFDRNTRSDGTASNAEPCHPRLQARDDAFMAELRAEHRHELRVTLVGGAIGLVLTLLATLVAFTIWGDTVPLEVSIVGGFLGIVFALGGVVLAHVIDARRNR